MSKQTNNHHLVLTRTPVVEGKGNTAVASKDIADHDMLGASARRGVHISTTTFKI
jgi:hypothetical protein